MLLPFYGTIFFVAFASGDSKARPNYLTFDDFARGRKLPSVLPNGTSLNLPHHDLLNSASSLIRDTSTNLNNGLLKLGKKKRKKRNAYTFSPWPNARVPYTLDSKFNNDQRAEVARAIENFHSKTCVQFVPKQSTDNDYVQILRDDNTCGLAQVCKAGGAQYAKFGGACMTSGVMTHELGHTLCFGHEQSRTDRDKYIAYDTSICEPNFINSANDVTSLDLLYDYVSIEHYEAECYNGCYKPKMPGVTKCGSGGDLSVLDVEKINAFYNCTGCYSYRFRPISLIADDKLVSGGIDYNGDPLHPCRGYFNGDIVVGKCSLTRRTCQVPYNGKEITLTENFEILTNPQNAKLKWIRKPSDGSFPANAIPGGRTAEREPLYFGLVAVDYMGTGNITVVIGKIHKSANPNKMYFPWEGGEYTADDYDILVCG